MRRGGHFERPPARQSLRARPPQKGCRSERDQAHFPDVPAALFRAPPPRRNHLRRKAPFFFARAAEKLFCTSSGKPFCTHPCATSTPAAPIDQPRMPAPALAPPACSSQHACAQLTGAPWQPQANGVGETLARNCTEAICGRRRLQFVSPPPDRRPSSSSLTR